MAKRVRRRGGLATWLHETQTPLFLLDDRRAVLFFNRGCEELTGWQAADVIGKVCDYVSEPDCEQVESVTGSFCPPPEVYGGVPQSVPAHIVHKHAGAAPVQMSFIPLAEADGGSRRVLGIITPRQAPVPPGEPTAVQQLHAELAAARTSLRRRYHVDGIVGRSEALRRVLEQVRLAHSAAAPVHIQGERGTGRERVARTIHYGGDRRLKAFVPLDCRVLPAFEMKSALRRLIEAAREQTPAFSGLQPGTLFLRNVESLPRDLQQLLLDEMDGETALLGGVRLMSSSSTPLADAVAGEALLEALYFRLTAIAITLPPLRRRMEDLPLLAQHLLEQLNRDQDRQITGFTDDVHVQLMKYNWPGNINELTSVIGEARAAAAGPLITAADLPFRFRTGLDAQTVGPPPLPRTIDLESYLAEMEAAQIRQALKEARYNKTLAADRLGLTRPRLYRRMQALKIKDRESERGTSVPR